MSRAYGGVLTRTCSPLAPTMVGGGRWAGVHTTSHSLKRQQALAFAGPRDNAGALTAVVDPTFELSSTIFKTLPKGSVLEKVQQTKLDVILHWSPDAQRAIELAYTATVPKLPTPCDDALHKFMIEECDFSTEHGDGSFLEHLHFCRDYAALHMSAYGRRGPRVMLLHSIFGVGTNCFPMDITMLPKLEELLDEEEFAQVQAFPSMLRLLVHGRLLSELARTDVSTLTRLKAIHFYRVLDNAPLELSSSQLFEQLNYQLIHAIDFLPPASWQRTSNEFFFYIFTEMRALLLRTDQLRVNVTSDTAKPDAVGARPPTWRHWLIDQLPDALVRKLAAKQVAKYSEAVGHSLDYELVY